MSENGGAASSQGTDELAVPSVKEILDGVAHEAGLSRLDDDVFKSDEEEAARDVARAMSSVRPLLRQYRRRYDELEGRLSQAQAVAATATREAREKSMAHLRTFERLSETCATVGQDLTESESRSSEHHGRGGDGGSEDATRGAAAAEADALATRHRSLVQRRRRMRSALKILEVSDKAKAALESAEDPERPGARAEEAMKCIELLGDLLGDNDRDGAARGRPPPSALRAAGHAPGQAGGELARVARGRLEWLTHRLRTDLSSELAAALREADPLTAREEAEEGRGRGRGRSGDKASGIVEERRREALVRVRTAVGRLLALQFGKQRRANPSTEKDPIVDADDSSRKHAGGAHREGSAGPKDSERRGGVEGGGGWRGGAVWALDSLLEPVAVRFRFHFEEERPTNRVDRPEWFLSFLLRSLEAYRPLLTGGDGGSGVDHLAYFSRGLALLARRRLRAQLGAVAADGSLLSHTVEEALAFDRQLDREAGYAECPARYPGQAWPRCVEVFAQDEARFERWMESDAAAAEGKLAAAAAAPGAWRAVGWKDGPRSSTPVTPSAVALCRIFSEITERYRPLRDPSKQLRFARNVQRPILRSYRDMLYWRGNECRVNSVFRDEAEEPNGATATWAAALAAALSPGQEGEDTTPIGRWRSYCLAASSCAYVCTVLRDAEDDILFVEMAESAAAAAGEVAGRAAAAPTSLGSMGNVVGAAVGGVSQAVTTVATTAETATAEVVRAVGAQGTIIGPTHAISAALTSLKDAARFARKATAAATTATPTVTVTAGDALNDTGNSSGEVAPVARVASGARVDEPSAVGAAAPAAGNDSDEGWGLVGGGDNAAAAAATADAGVAPRTAREGGDGSGGVGVARLREAGGSGGLAAAGAAVGEAGEEGAIFGEESRRYGDMLDAMMQGAVASCRDGFLWCTRSYLRAWDRGIAVVVATSTSGVAEPSGRLAAGVELLATAMAVAEGSLPPEQFRRFWTALASELDSVLGKQIIARRQEMTQDEGLQLRVDLKALMGPFSVPARRRPEKLFSGLTETVLLVSLEQSQLRSLSSGLDAHGGGVEEAHRGPGWDGWREEGGTLSPEGVQMRDMLENVGVRRLGPVEASLLLEKRIKGHRRALLGVWGEVSAGARPPSFLSEDGGGGGISVGFSGDSGDGFGRAGAGGNSSGLAGGGGIAEAVARREGVVS